MKEEELGTLMDFDTWFDSFDLNRLNCNLFVDGVKELNSDNPDHDKINDVVDYLLECYREYVVNNVIINSYEFEGFYSNREEFVNSTEFECQF